MASSLTPPSCLMLAAPRWQLLFRHHDRRKCEWLCVPTCVVFRVEAGCRLDNVCPAGEAFQQLGCWPLAVLLLQQILSQLLVVDVLVPRLQPSRHAQRSNTDTGCHAQLLPPASTGAVFVRTAVATQQTNCPPRAQSMSFSIRRSSAFQ